MVLPGIIETPHTEAGNATYLSNGVPDFSIEPSFVDDVGHRFRGNDNHNGLITPGARRPLTDRRNAPGGNQGVEFTPLLKSVARTTLARQANGQNAVPPTPAVLKAGYQSTGNSPALPLDATVLNGGDTESSFDQEDAGATTMPPVSSSSMPSTPLATLPKSDRAAVVTDGRKMMTLREQENIVNKIEKENFGLKLKIHFLEDALRKAGPGVGEGALRENADLKVEKYKLHKEVSRLQKQLREAQEQTIRRPANDGQREEIRRLVAELSRAEVETKKLGERLEASESQAAAEASFRDEARRARRELSDAEAEIEDLNTRLTKAQMRENAAGDLNDEVDDLKAELREKKRTVEERDTDVNDLHDKMAALQIESEAKARLVGEQGAALASLRDEVTVLKSDVRRKEALLQEKDGEVNDLKDEIVVLQSNMDDDGERAKEEVLAVSQDIDALRDQVRALTNDRELRDEQLRSYQEKQTRHEATERERDTLKKQLQIYHETEARNNASQKERAMLQKELDDARARVQGCEKEVQSLRTELADRHTRTGQFEKERNLIRRELEDSRAQNLAYETERSVLKRELHDVQAQVEVQESLQKKQTADQRHQRDSESASCAALEPTIVELRTEISRLQKSMQSDQQEDNQTTTQQRRELHKTVMATKHQVEELQRQLSEHHRLTEAYAHEKRDLRTRLRRAGEERAVQSQKANNATAALERLRRQHDAASAKVVDLERTVAEQTRTAQSITYESDRQHRSELKGLSKQIMYLRSQCAREGRFRADLAFVKKYFLMQMEMYNACNIAGLQMLEDMGIIPDRSIRERKPSLKSVVYLVIAALRMKHLKDKWAGQVKVKQKFVTSALQMKK